MNFFAIILIFFVLTSGSKFQTKSVRKNNDLNLDLPIDENGIGRLKVQIKNLNIEKSSKFFLKSLAQFSIFSTLVISLPVTIFWTASLVCMHRVHFPMVGAKTQLPSSNKKGWKTENRDKALHPFEFHHRGISGSSDIRSFDTRIFKTVWDYQECKEDMEFIFDFSDQLPKNFGKLDLKVPNSWSGYELKWFLSEDAETKVPVSTNMPNENPFETINLISFLGTEPKKFFIYARFTQKKYQRRATDIDLLTLDYQLFDPIPNNNEYKLILKDGTIFLSKEFVKTVTPSIDMLFRNQEEKSNSLDLKESPLLVSHFDLLKELIATPFIEYQTLFSDSSNEEMIDLILLMDYLLVPRNYMNNVFQVLLERINLSNGCLIIQKLPKVGSLAEFRKEIDMKLKDLLVKEMKSENLEITDICKSFLKIND